MKNGLICFDVDGTLIDGTVYIWKTLHEYFRTDVSERQKAFRDYFDGIISYRQWAEHDIKLLKSKNADKKSIAKAFACLALIPGVEETLRYLKKRDHRLVIISGSVDLALETAFPQYSRYFDAVFLNRLLFDSSDALVGVQTTPYDLAAKADGLVNMAAKFNIPLQRTVFIGDNENDLSAAETAGLSIAFNCKSQKLEKISRHVIAEKNLKKIIPLIDQWFARTE